MLPAEDGVGAGAPVEEIVSLPTAFALYAAVPNPFNPQTTIRFKLPRNAKVWLSVYDVAGRFLPAGRHTEEWEGRDNRGRTVAAGVYFYRLTAGSYTETKRMVLVK